MFDISNIIRFGKMIMANENELICDEGTPSSGLIYVIVSGEVSIFSNKINVNEKCKMLEFSKGDTFGETSLFGKRAYPYSAVVTKKAVIISLYEQQFLDACKAFPELAISSIKCISKELNCLFYKEFIPQKKEAEKVITDNVQKVEIKKENAVIFPIGVKLYNENEPKTYPDFVYDYETVCPICKSKVVVKAQHTTRLVMTQTDYDLHKHYKDFEPVWYNIWTCKNCYYSNLHYDFEKPLPAHISEKDLVEHLKKVKEEVKLNFTFPKNIDEVFATYYIAIYCATFYEANNIKMAKLWLQLSWLYRDIEDNEMYLKAAQKALDYYCKMYYDSNEELEPINEQACYVVMAELFILFKDYDRALKFLLDAKKIDGGNRYYTLRADRRAQDVRDLYHQQKELNK